MIEVNFNKYISKSNFRKMKKLLSCFFLFAILCISVNNSFALGFNSIYTPDGVNVIAVGDAGKVFRSTNAGNIWASYTINSEDLKSVYSIGNDVWIGASNGNVYKTGKTVSAITSYNVGASFTINSICFYSPSIGYLCGDNGNVYKTENGGVNWSPISSGIMNVKLNSISCIDDQKLIVVGNEGTAYMTDNRGSSWSLESTGTTKNILKVKYYIDGIVAAGEYGTLLTKTTTGAWTPVVTRTDSDIRGISGTSFNDIHVCGGGGFIRNNTNGSANFFNFELNPMLANLTDIFYYDANLGFAVSGLNSTIIKTTNAGQTWEMPAGTSIAMNWVQKTPAGSGIGNNLCRHPKVRDTYFVVYGNKVYVSRNKGDSWVQIATISIGTRAHSFYVSALDSNVWMAAIESTPDKVVRSTDYGATWNTILSYNFSSYGQPLEMDQNNPGTYYYAPDGVSTGFFKSTDDGATFTNINTNNPFTSACDIICEWDNSNTIFVGDDGADIYKSTTNGTSWNLVKPTSSSEVPSMCNSVFDTKICYATTWSSTQVFKTINKGDSWNQVSNNSGSGWGSDLCHEDPNVVLTGNYGSQSYLTTNGGATFSSVNTGLSGAGAGIMVPDRGVFLNMQTGSLYKLNIVYTTLTSNENIISTVPAGFELSQNYPNPFNPSTSIKFALPVAGSISLKIYDRLGKEVETLADGFRTAGTYEINFDASKLTSGVYFYKLVTDGFTNTKKMILVK